MDLLTFHFHLADSETGLEQIEAVRFRGLKSIMVRQSRALCIQIFMPISEDTYGAMCVT